MFSRRALILLVLVGLALAVLSDSACQKHVAVQPAKLDFTLKDMNGHDVRLSDFRGKALIVNFFGTDCGPCQLETPELVDLAAKYKARGLAVVGISIEDSPQEIQQFAAKYNITYPLLVGEDREDVQNALGLGDGIPTSVFITSKGMVWGSLEGLATQSWIEKQIQNLF